MHAYARVGENVCMRVCECMSESVCACDAVHCIALHRTALRCSAMHTALHCTALHCTALHCTALHCTARCKYICKYMNMRANVYICELASELASTSN